MSKEKFNEDSSGSLRRRFHGEQVVPHHRLPGRLDEASPRQPSPYKLLRHCQGSVREDRRTCDTAAFSRCPWWIVCATYLFQLQGARPASPSSDYRAAKEDQNKTGWEAVIGT